MQNFMVVALLQSLAAALLFPLFLLAPGYLFARTSNLLSFRKASGSEQFLISVAFSMATTPVFAVLLGRYVGVSATLAVFLLAAIVSAGFFLQDWRTRDRRLPRPRSRSTTVAVCLVAAWSLLALLSVVDWQIGHRLFVSAIVYDHSVRVPFVASVIRNGLPPLNPFFDVGNAPVLRYYYYWYVVAALPGELSGLPARACLNASILWCGFALAAIIPLYLKHFLRESSELRRKSVVGIALLLVTGLDVIPYSLLCLRSHMLLADMEWWDTNQVTSWMASLLWVPHHVAALVACMTGLLVISQQEEDSSFRERLWMALFSSVAFASAAGLSLYVTFTFAVCCVPWIIALLFQRRIRDVLTWLVASAVALALSAPYLHDLLSGPSAAGTRFAIFALRDFPLGTSVLQSLGVHNSAVLDFSNIPILALVYFFEFGLFFCVLALQFKRELLGDSPLRPLQKCAWIFFTTCLLVVTFLKSDTTGSNDLGFRGILPVQFILLVWAAPIVSDLFASSSARPRISNLWRGILYTTIFIGVLSTAVQLALLRGFSMLVDAKRVTPVEGYLQVPEIGNYTFLLQQGFADLDRQTAKNDLYQFDVSSSGAWLIRLYSSRPFAAGDDSCGATFGGDPATCAQALPYLEAPFQSGISTTDVNAICSRFRLRILLVTDVDPVWHDPTSWVWQSKPIVANDAMRAFACGTI